MRIFLAGDHVTGTGPANVTKYYIENLPEGTLYQKRRNKLLRVIEIAINTLKCDVAVYSGYSKQNILGMKLAKWLKKPCAYIFHGCVEYENGINLEPDEEMTRVERKTLELADLIICVSESFCNWAGEYYPMFADKFDYVTNGLGTKPDGYLKDQTGRDMHMILSVGGGMPRKKIVHICEAVERLRHDHDPDMYVRVIGAKGADTPEIDAFSHVKDLGVVSHEEAEQLFEKAGLYIQNSCFETFALAPLEALGMGCPILCSRKVGALSLIKDLQPGDVIERYDDPDEIAQKIKKILEDPNARRLADSIEWERGSWKERSRELTEKLSKLVLKR